MPRRLHTLSALALLGVSAGLWTMIAAVPVSSSPAPSTPAAGASPSSSPAPIIASVKVGDLAPDFTLLDGHRAPVTLSSFRGHQQVLLVFYVFAFSPG